MYEHFVLHSHNQDVLLNDCHISLTVFTPNRHFVSMFILIIYLVMISGRNAIT